MGQKWDEKQLREAIQSSISIAQTLRHLGMVTVGSNYQTVRRAIKKFDIDTSHFMGWRWMLGKEGFNKKPITDYLNGVRKISTTDLRIRLIKEKMLEAICSNCNLSAWLSGPIPLELHHKDGNRYNNALSNLVLLCPNCHALTKDYRGKKNKKNPNWRHDPKPNRRKVTRPTKEELQKLIDEIYNWRAIGRMFGVSDVAVKKWAKQYGLQYSKRKFKYCNTK